MKKLMLIALSILGLQSASVHGASYAAMAANWAPKALSIFNAMATPVLVGASLYAIDQKSNAIGQNVIQAANQVDQKANSFFDKVGPVVDFAVKVAGSSHIQRALGVETQEPWSDTWYGKTWQGICAVDKYTTNIFSYTQKYVQIFQAFQGVMSLIKNSDQEEAGPRLTPQQAQAYKSYVAAKQQEQAQVAASQPVYTPGRSGRSRARRYG